MATRKIALLALLILALIPVVSAENIFPKLTATNYSEWANGSATSVSIAQEKANYTLFLPWFDWNDTNDKPQLFTGFVELMHFGGDIFAGPPSEMSMLDYEYVINITNINGTTSPITVTLAPNDTSPGNSDAVSQSLGPIAVFTGTFFDFESNSTVNFTVNSLCPGIMSNACGDGSSLEFYDSSNLNTSWTKVNATDGLTNITFVYNTSTLTINATNKSATEEWRAFKVKLGLYNRSVSSAGEWMGPPPFLTSPVWIQNQVATGMFAEMEPPEPGTQMASSVGATLINKMNNFTANNIFAEFFVPTTVKVNGTQYNITNESTVNLQWLNCSTGSYQQIWGPPGFGPASSAIINSTDSFAFNDSFEDSPAKGSEINVSFHKLYVNLSAIDCNGISNNGWNNNENVSLLFNFTMSMPEFGSKNTTSGDNRTVDKTIYAPVDEASMKFENNSLPNWDSRVNSSINVTVNGKLIYKCGSAEAGNSTLNPDTICWEGGSVVVRGLESGTNAVRVSYQTTPGSGGDSGAGAGAGAGAGGTTGNATSATGRVSHIFAEMQPGRTEVLKITDKEMGLSRITIEVRNMANNVRIIVQKLDEQPASIVHNINGKVYKYFEITTENLADDNIKSASFEFKVDLEWLKENKVALDDVELLRFTNRWDSVTVALLDEDDDGFAVYSAEPPGFSVFAITGKSAEAEEVVPEVEAVPGEPEAGREPVQLPKPEGPSAAAIAIIILLVLVAVFYYYHKQKKTEKGKYHGKYVKMKAKGE